MKPISYIIALFILTGVHSFAQEYDDLYFNSSDRKALELENKNKHSFSKKEEQYNREEYQERPSEDYVQQNDYYSDNNDNYSYLNNNYYSDDDYYYSRSLKRFYNPTYVIGYNSFIYSDYWFNPYPVTYASYYSPWNSYGYGSGFNIGWNSYNGWNLGFNSWGYGGYYGWGYPYRGYG